MSLRCSAWARRLAEPLGGTAPEALGWLVVEIPGPWGRDAAIDHRHGPGIDEVVTLPDGVRFQAIRRPERLEPAALRVILAHSGPRPWAVTSEIGALADLADLPVAATLDAEPPAWGTPLHDPLFLVCTHAKRDECCALYGRPIYDALEEVHGDRVWETSHTGGHRFAANLLIVPDGLLYGGLTPFDANHVAEQHLDGRVSVAHLRGRSALPQIAQAAEVALRRELDLVDRDDVSFLRVEGTAVSFDVDGHEQTVTMTAETLEPHPVSCGADPVEKSTWKLISIEAR